jgi:DNA repair exonuclease SbcCD ATPase subunit
MNDGDSKRQILKLHQANQELNSKIFQLVADKGALEDINEQLREQKTVVDEELKAADKELTELKQSLEAAKSLASTYEREARDAENRLNQNTMETDMLKVKLQGKEELLHHFEVCLTVTAFVLSCLCYLCTCRKMQNVFSDISRKLILCS